MSGVVSGAAMVAGTVEDGAETGRGNGRAQGATCARCGYRLAGLEEVACCPECGLAARLSREPDHLSLRAAWYLKRLRVGAALIIAALVMALGAVLAAAAMTQSMDGPFAFVFFVCSPALWLAGWWLMHGRQASCHFRHTFFSESVLSPASFPTAITGPQSPDSRATSQIILASPLSALSAKTVMRCPRTRSIGLRRQARPALPLVVSSPL